MPIAQRCAIASDHAGFRYKTMLVSFLSERGYVVVDFGTGSEEPVDYPDAVGPAAEAVAGGDCALGILIGGSGNGEAMAANRLRGIRCAVCWSEETARLARAHNDANMIALGQRLLPEDLVRRIVEAWLSTPFEGGRHAVRIAKLDR
jgi:ribose 5-phosphate isomerase B